MVGGHLDAIEEVSVYQIFAPEKFIGIPQGPQAVGHGTEIGEDSL